MKLYIAGGTNGNLGKWFWDNMDLYLASGLNGLSNWFWDNLDLYITMQKDEFYKRLNILESFYYIKNWQIPLIPKFKSFMLDSGAFTFMQQKNIKPDFEKYTYKYAEFINKNNIELFFEMDIDSVVGLKEVERLRKIIEKETGKKCIPVWHKSRGKEYFLNLCNDYNYIAVGGLVTKTTMQKSDYKYINWFCDVAHKNNCMIHGLGFTKTNLQDYHFDSVDSTAWTYGNRGKFIYEFNGNLMTKHDMGYKNNKLKSRETAIHNFMEWVKWSEHLERTSTLREITTRKTFLAGTFSRRYLYE